MKDITIDIIITTEDNKQVHIPTTIKAEYLFNHFSNKQGMCAIYEVQGIALAYCEYMHDNGDTSINAPYNIGVFNENSTEQLFKTTSEV